MKKLFSTKGMIFRVTVSECCGAKFIRFQGQWVCSCCGGGEND